MGKTIARRDLRFIVETRSGVGFGGLMDNGMQFMFTKERVFQYAHE